MQMTLKVARVLRNLTQGELAALIGTTKENVHNWETGKSKPSIKNGFKLARALEVNINDLEDFLCQ